jgi:outer membrane receptor protein involved in Fe transport
MCRLLFCTLVAARAGVSAEAEPAPDEPATFESQPLQLATVTVLASPFSASNPQLPSRGTLLSADSLRRAPQSSLDGVLREVPGFRLFRRTDSLGAHPTAQGFSLSNVGPNGASRSILLLDGIPLNDPFGGWVPWSRLPPVLLASAQAQPRAGVSPWGTGSLGGVLALESRLLRDAPFTLLETRAGNRLRFQTTAAFATDSASGRDRLFGSVHAVDFRGYPVIREGQRGAVDVAAGMRSQSFDAGLRHAFSEERDWHLTLRAMGWRESRNAGTLLTRNESRALDLSLRLVHDEGPGENASETLLFGQRRAFSSLFSSVATDRSRETPTLDQYAVPARAWGVVQRVRLVLSETHTLSGGADLRVQEGHTEENTRYQQNAFTRQRIAGGRQLLGGLSVQDVWTPHEQWKFSSGIRWDVLQDSRGALRERPLSGTAPPVHQQYASRTRSLPHANAEVSWLPSQKFEATGCLYTGSRAPTLNELYRPFRAGDVSTLANSALRSESLWGGELQLRATPTPRVEMGMRVFANQLRNAIANLTLVRGPGSFPAWGTLAPGATGARRENVERAEVAGMETRLTWKLAQHWKLNANWLGTRSRITECLLAPELRGKALPQMPASQISLQLEGSEGPWNANFSVRHVGRQFEDDANQQALRGFWTFDARLGHAVGPHAEVFVCGENLANAEIQTRRDASGLIATGMPRLWSAGLRFEF